VRKNSPYSYIIELTGKQKWCHANHLRKYNERVTEVINHNCSIIFDSDRDFGTISTIQINDQTVYKSNTHFDVVEADGRDVTYDEVTRSLPSLTVDETNSYFQSDVLNDSGDANLEQSFSSSLLSTKIDMSKLIHLSGDQQQELLQLIDEFQSCFYSFLELFLLDLRIARWLVRL